MRETSPIRIQQRFLCVILTLAVLAAGLAPWWRNRAYLRSFFDYGVVIGGIGRIDSGQHPYVDFITPIQTGWYFLNRLAEKIAGGTFQAMTWSGAASIVISTIVLMGILSRRWPVIGSAIITAAMVCSTVVQHTILWYNPWGVVLLAVVTWSCALAPVYLRSTAWWHVLVALALYLGGLNKINMQLLAIVMAAGWAWRAGLNGKATWGRVAATIAGYLFCGLVLPIGTEMRLTGAPFSLWWHNVIALPAASRSGTVLAAFSWNFFFHPPHDHYGRLLLPQIGLVGLVLTILTLVSIWRKSWNASGVERERIVPLACAMLAIATGVVLLTTNIDIDYIGLAGWLALLAGLWLGFDLPSKGRWFYGVMVGPSLLIAAVAWWSAWEGQRSQFGHSSAPRTAYIPGEKAGPSFEYFRGTLLPPELTGSLEVMALWRQSLAKEVRDGIFYGPGTEWSAHIWPALKTPGLPIYVHVGNSMGRAEYERLHAAFWNGNFREITVSLVLDRWDDKITTVLADKYERTEFRHGMFYHYSRNPGSAISGAPLPFIRRFGGNVDVRHIASTAQYFEAEDKMRFLGTMEGKAEMFLDLTTNRLKGDVIVRRQTSDMSQPLSADFSIFAQFQASRLPRWSAKVELPAGQNEILVPYAIDSSHLPTTLVVEVSAEQSGKVIAGWKSPHITDVGSDTESPAWLNRSPFPVAEFELNEDVLAKILPGNWRPAQARMRGGRITADGVELFPGGEIWLKVQGVVSKLAGVAKVVPNSGPERLPVASGVWYKGGRLQTYASDIPATGTERYFQSWCAEPGGWLVVVMDPTLGMSPVSIRFTDVKQN